MMRSVWALVTNRRRRGDSENTQRPKATSPIEMAMGIRPDHSAGPSCLTRPSSVSCVTLIAVRTRVSRLPSSADMMLASLIAANGATSAPLARRAHT
ncbi:hypothetical protein [Caulobacter vibrioides]|uniref:Uncharacterized protein n=1 Tax=Caulobacter vibrioides (strain NA1000 / CB15N) TaxID=565050 RepID=A0A0H3J435_CAUVN|nr:hypothetical protein [Caulobacter vibrioides]YP_009020511.1 hypothetical protein CCNA_03939 [Caulobacter vibrioides NA1000]AHI88542.1 hypothetical protein CCNA_03939 [Caulobacter vibrioides NA1000]QXZ53928.1 hypothetical protein KZH45_03920 [Caulobacter vibrioides]